MAKSAQEQFDELVEERDKLKKEINKWIYTASVFEREKDTYKAVFSKLAESIVDAFQVIHKKINLKKT